MIEATPKASVQDVRAMQGDLVSLAARDLLPFLAAAEPASDAGRAARDLLAGWDGVMAPDRPEPLVFSAWLLEATRRLLGDDLGPELAAEWASRPEFLAATLAGGTPGWCDDRRTTLIETCTDLVAAALDSSVADLAGRYGDDPRRWRWDAAHRARHAHPVLGRLPVIGDLFAVTQPIGGDRFSVNVSSLAGDGEDPYLSRFGAGLRAIYDLADLDRSLFVVAVGQSGNPFSEHYADLAEAWLANEPFTIPAVRPSGPGTHALRLVPAP
jgi:penicillin amidase